MKEIADSYGKLLERVDEWFHRCLKGRGSRIRCAGGCSSCCRGLFDITLLDAWYLKQGFNKLAPSVRLPAVERSRERLLLLKREWPELSEPYILNYRQEDDWEALMPDDDETPCPLLDSEGRCLVYAHRPMTCRLHGLPLIDVSGEVFHDEWCTLNFIDLDPLVIPELRWEFDALFREELRQFRVFTERLVGRSFNELDTFIPTALLLDYNRYDWRRWVQGFIPFPEVP